MADIRFFFRPVDVDHMGAKGIDLGTYDGVKKSALAIYAHTAPPNPDMPPDAAGQWTADRSQTFKNWIVNGYPVGTATPQVPGPSPVPDVPGARVRKNIASLSAGEITALQAAFTGVMARDASQADSYFAIAGLHGKPGNWCLHHEDRFNPWHRVYLKQFEDALRSIPGCQDLTLPYWDLTTPLPDLLQQPPFASYTLPQAVPGEPFPFTTVRNDPATITQNLTDNGVFNDITTSLAQSLWGAYNLSGYQDFSIQAHDGGHVSIGPTMADQDVASYDPVFWFYHCNLDRLWLQWQQKVGGTTLAGFKSTLSSGDTDWLSAPFNALPPSTTTADESIAFGISYDDGVAGAEKVALENKAGSIEAARTFSIKRSSPVSVRVKDIDRLSIPGSFVVSLLADGAPIAKRAFFQRKSPRDCETCKKLPLINIDFRVDPEEILDRKLSVAIDVPGQKEMGTQFPLAQAGNPTINARLLLEDE
ncbi:MAG: tyrosinase family protein [Actinomycetota bacterium]|nr:tyrosinase family protein [Actinomycetota bacterium]